MGLNYFNRASLIGSIAGGMLQTGEESITSRIFEPYADYLKESFPSGTVSETLFFDANIQWWLKPNLSFMSGIQWDAIFSGISEVTFNIGIDVYWPAGFTI